MSRWNAEHETIFLGGEVRWSGVAVPAEALLVRGGRVAVVGPAAEVKAAASPGATVEHLEGGVVTPGLTDSHVHLTAWALARGRIDLNGTASLEEGLTRVAAGLNGGGEWVLGLGWDLHRWQALPDRHALDRVVPDRPVLLESHDLHAAWLNSEALWRCGIDRDTPDPPGGEIIRDPVTGDPTGVLVEEARKLAFARVPLPGASDIQESIIAAQRHAHSLGLTGMHSVEPHGLADCEALYHTDRLRLRILQHIALDHLDEAIGMGLHSGSGGDWIRIGGVKMFLDGALGSRTAWMHEPYEGRPDSYGIRIIDRATFRRIVERAADAGLASTVHAIGDAAVEMAIDILSAVRPPAAIPHRIEHLQLCPPRLWDRAAGSGIVASMQSIHLLTDLPTAERDWGHERCQGAFAFAPLLERGMTLALGSDAPVESIDPRGGLFAAVRRVTWQGEPAGEWYPENSLSPAQALAAYTRGPALAAGEAGRRGQLSPGADADLVIWDRDPVGVPPEELLEMRCLLTMVAGEVVYRAEHSDSPS
ncbi:MAG TPA: amidohydrolase [Longimicrobiaceae bacterium]|nr:amidohydrolase [Longimicrobiaceae bacterium]